ncbi:MAG: hypothetical protein AAFN41_12780, partial [Planctomycetota bacterium]
AELDDQMRELEAKLEDPDIMADHNAVRELSIKRAALDPVVGGWRDRLVCTVCTGCAGSA